MHQQSQSQYRQFIRFVIEGNFEGIKEIISSLEREKVIKWVRFHMLGSYLYDHVPSLNELELDKTQAIIFHRILDKMLEILSSSPVEVVVFKGGHIREIYPKRYWRAISDLDVYVRKSDAQYLEEFLLSKGFKLKFKEQFQHRYEFMGIPLEVHTRFARRIFPDLIREEVVFVNSRKIKGSILFPSFDLEITIFYFHAYKSAYTSGFRAIWWLDERFLKLNGAKPLNLKRIDTCIDWFRSFSFENLTFNEGNEIYRSFMGILHAIRLRL